MNSRRRVFPSTLWWLLIATAFGVLAGLLPWLAGQAPWAGLVIIVGLLGAVILLVGWPFSGVATLMLAALLTHYHIDISRVSLRPEHLALLAVALVAGWQWVMQRGRLRLPLAAWLALAWWGANLLSGAFFSPATLYTLQNAVRVGAGVLTFLLVLNLIPDRRQWWWAVWFYLGAGVAEAAFGILARILYPFGINLGIQVGWTFTEPIPYGTFEEGNLFGSHSAAWALVLLMILLVAGNWRRPTVRQVLLLGGLSCLLLGLFLSLSRAAWLMFAAGLVLVWAFHRRNSWVQANRFLLAATLAPFVIFLVLSIAPFLPASWPFVNRLQSFLHLGADPTFSARLEDWTLAIGDWLRQPLTGWGPGSFAAFYGALRYRPAWIGSLSVRLLQETGLLGALAFITYLLALLLPAFKLSGRLNVPRDRAALLGLVIAYIALLSIAYQSTDGIWLAASWIHAGLIAAGTRVLAPSQHEPDPPPSAL